MTKTSYEDVIAIVKLIDGSSCQDVKLAFGDLQLHVRKSQVKLEPSAATPFERAYASPSSQSPQKISSSNVVEPKPAPLGTAVTAPMIGTFYRAPSPDAPPFVEVGDIVTADTVLCIVEAMKVMNTLKAGVSGVVVDIAAENNELVEFGQRLFTIGTKAGT